jgi:hypothetical protein
MQDSDGSYIMIEKKHRFPVATCVVARQKPTFRRHCGRCPWPAQGPHAKDWSNSYRRFFTLIFVGAPSACGCEQWAEGDHSDTGAAIPRFLGCCQATIPLVGSLGRGRRRPLPLFVSDCVVGFTIVQMVIFY